MKLNAMHLEEFGPWSSLSLQDLPRGLTVLHADSEGDKTALVDFVVGMLYGFDPRMPAAGTLSVSARRGNCHLLRRNTPGKPQEFAVVTADKRQHDPSATPPELNQVDQGTFQRRFVLDLVQQSGFGALAEREAAAYLYELSQSGEPASVPRSFEQLDKTRQHLVSADGTFCQLSQMQRRRQRLVQQLRELSTLTLELARTKAQCETVQSQLAHLQAAVERLRETARRLQRASRLKAMRDRMEEIERELARTSEHTEDDPALREELAALQQRIERTSHKLERLRNQRPVPSLDVDLQQLLLRTRQVLAQQRSLADQEVSLSELVAQLGRVKSLLDHDCCYGPHETEENMVDLANRIRRLKVDLSARRHELDAWLHQTRQMVEQVHGVSLEHRIESQHNNSGETQARIERLEALLARLRLRRDEVEARLQSLSHLAARSRQEEQARREALQSEYRLLREELESALRGDVESAAIADLLSRYASPELDRQAEQAQRELEQTERELQRESDRLSELQSQLEALSDDRRCGKLRLEILSLDEAIRRHVQQWHVVSLAHRSLQAASAYQDHPSKLLEMASLLIARLTGGKYTKVIRDRGQHRLLLQDNERETRELDRLRQETRELVYLSLRLALVIRQHDQGHSLPLLVDDLPVKFEGRLGRAFAEILVWLAEQGHQILMFTCHDYVLRLFAELDVPIRRLTSPPKKDDDRRRRVDVPHMPPEEEPEPHSELSPYDRYKQAEIGEPFRREFLDGYDRRQRERENAERSTAHFVSENSGNGHSAPKPNYSSSQPAGYSSSPSNTLHWSPAAAVATPTMKPATRSLVESTSQELRFYLNVADPVVDAPSIGPRTAERLEKIGIVTVRDLLQEEPEDAATRLSFRRIKADTIRQWQQQASLVCRIPELRGHDAQMLVALDITRPDQLAHMEPHDLLRKLTPLVNSKEGERILRGGKEPDLEEVRDWIRWAKKARRISPE